MKTLILTSVMLALFVGCSSEPKQMNEQECKESYITLQNMQSGYKGNETDKKEIINFRDDLEIKCSEYRQNINEKSFSKKFNVDVNAGEKATGRKW